MRLQLSPISQTLIDLNPSFQMPTVPRMFEAAPVKFKQAGGLKPATLEKLEELEELVTKEQVCFWLSWFGIYVTGVFFSYSFQDQCVQDVGGSFVQAGTGRGSEAFDVVEFAKSQVGGRVIEVI